MCFLLSTGCILSLLELIVRLTTITHGLNKINLFFRTNNLQIVLSVPCGWPYGSPSHPSLAFRFESDINFSNRPRAVNESTVASLWHGGAAMGPANRALWPRLFCIGKSGSKISGRFSHLRLWRASTEHNDFPRNMAHSYVKRKSFKR